MNQVQAIIDVSEATFQTDVIQESHNVPVVVDFWAPWCGPCRIISPVLERLANEAQGAFRLAKINVDENPSLAMRYGVQGIPAVKAFRNGQPVSEFVGAQPEPVIRKFIKELAPSETDRTMETAAGLLAAQRWAEAEPIYRQAWTAQPEDSGAALGLVKALLAQGKATEAQEILTYFPAGPELAAVESLKPLAAFMLDVESGAEELKADEKLGALYYRAGELAKGGSFQAAMDALLDVMRRNKRYRDGLAHKAMLGIFELLGDQAPLVESYRRQLATVLF